MPRASRGDREMTDKEKRQLFSQAVKQWGVDAQVLLAIEEMSELIKELCKLKRRNYSYTAESIQALIGEIADVRLMIDQVAYMFDINGQDMYNLRVNHLKELLSQPEGEMCKHDCMEKPDYNERFCSKCIKEVMGWLESHQSGKVVNGERVYYISDKDKQAQLKVWFGEKGNPAAGR